jgi:hypothetical protein
MRPSYQSLMRRFQHGFVAAADGAAVAPTPTTTAARTSVSVSRRLGVTVRGDRAETGTCPRPVFPNRVIRA